MVPPKLLVPSALPSSGDESDSWATQVDPYGTYQPTTDQLPMPEVARGGALLDDRNPFSHLQPLREALCSDHSARHDLDHK